MAFTTINKPNEYFNTKLYTGNESTNAITGIGFQPDWVWLKAKDSGGTDHFLFDAIRGVQKNIHSNTSDAEVTTSNSLTAFDFDGFTLGSDVYVNGSGQPHVSWNWKAGGTASSNTDGSITSSVSASTTSGFSVVTYTGNGSAGATIGHGLGSTPSAIFVKGLSAASNWSSYHSVLGNTGYMRLDGTGAFATASTYWNNTSPDNNVFTVGTTGNINASGNDFVAYCFAEKKGFSKFGSYVGNGSTDGTFIYTGFKPAFVMVKNYGAVEGWSMFDNKRSTSGANVIDDFLIPSSSEAEISQNVCDFVSNGFKFRAVDGKYHNSGGSYIYMAFAENPLVGTNGVPTTAR